MRLRIEDFVDKAIDPLADFVPLTPDEEIFENGLLDPALLMDELELPPNLLTKWIVQRGMNSVLRQQQFLVYDMATKIGVLQPYVGVTQNALKAFDVIIDSIKTETIASQAILTAIGQASQVLSAVPTIYTQIAGAIGSLGVAIASLFTGGPFELQMSRIPSQEYSKDTDADQFNSKIRAFTQASQDWTTIFSPRYEGELTMRTATDDANRMVWAWALGDGVVPQIVVEKQGQKQYGVPTPSGKFDAFGLGMIPGGQRIFSVVQSTLLEPPAQVNAGHPTVYDPRCGSVGKVQTIDVGTFYPTSAQAGMSLWDFLFQRGASCYTVNAYTLSEQWAQYFAAIWRGVQKYWGNPNWQGVGAKNFGGSGGLKGWGAGPWEEALGNLVQNYTVGMNNVIGGFGAWRPKECKKQLTDADAENWSRGSALYGIILPALSKLAYAQKWYLDNTTIAAYLPINGGVNADPTKGDDPMGAFRGNSQGTQNLIKAFMDARKRILNGAQKYEVRLDDVIDPTYRHQLEAKGGGTQGIGSFVAAPQAAQLAWTPTGGAMPPQRTPTADPRAPKVIAAASAVAAGAAAYYFADDLGRVREGARRRIRRR